MKIAHLSDSHGISLRDEFPIPRGVDVVCHTGDFFPNRTRGFREVEKPFQEYWLRENLDEIVEWIGERKLLLVQGNHDYFDPTAMLVAAGVDAVHVGHTIETCHDIGLVRFAGFPFVKYFSGEWNFEVSEQQIAAACDVLPQDVTVLMVHGPPYGVRDRNGQGERCGSLALRKYLLEAMSPPRLLLFGHIHESAGVLSWTRGIEVSNAATRLHVLEV